MCLCASDCASERARVLGSNLRFKNIIPIGTTFNLGLYHEKYEPHRVFIPAVPAIFRVQVVSFNLSENDIDFFVEFESQFGVLPAAIIIFQQ